MSEPSWSGTSVPQRHILWIRRTAAPVDHATLGLLLGPTSDVQLELAFARDATVGRRTALSRPRFDVAVRDGGGGDTMVLSGAGYVPAQGLQPATPISRSPLPTTCGSRVTSSR
ncbi:MAG: hypothetical protein R3E12_01580 [Candidatus Eisenbacteria bacterium]